MSAAPKRPMTRFACIVLAGLALPAGSEVARAAEPQSPDQIIKALKPPVRATRSLTTTPADATRNVEDARFVDTLRKRTTRSLTIEERDKITSIAQKKPSVDLEINFEYNSADISAKSLPSVQALGRALTNNDLKGSTFVVAGHTDAAGGDAYNQDLSERRADAIKRYLVDKYGINGTDLVAVGYGKSKLKDPSQPLAEVNRRVQVVNMENKSTAANAAK